MKSGKKELYVVGGYVRDLMLGVTSKDIDFTYVSQQVNATVETGFLEMTKFLEDNNFKIFLSTPDCFTIRAMFPEDSEHKGLVADFVLSRKEIGYTPGTRKPILELGTIEDDLLRRDFTVNAMAFDCDGNLIDLFNGQQDLKDKILKTPLNPETTFLDDPLRILRAVRFSITKDFKISDDLRLAMCNKNLLDLLFKTVSKERIREELLKCFKHNTFVTLKLLQNLDEIMGDFTGRLFTDGFWLEPTFKK